MIYRLTLIAAALPLLAYPAILMAGVMGLSAPADSNTLEDAIAKAYLWSSLLYPFGYTAALVACIWSARAGAAIAAGHLCLCIALFIAWWGVSR